MMKNKYSTSNSLLISRRILLKILCIICLVIFPFSQSFANEREFYAKVAVVDIDSILEHSSAIKHIKKTINNISNKLQDELTQREIELKRIEEALIKQHGVLTEEEFNKNVIEFNKKVTNIQQETQNKKAALEQAHSEAISEVHKNTIAVISELSKEYGFNIVFPSSQVMFVENNLNITLEVINKLNQRLETVEVHYTVE